MGRSEGGGNEPAAAGSLGAPPAPTIDRPDLVARLAAARHVPVVALIAPTGYGKTTLLRQWEAADPRPFAWIPCNACAARPQAVASRVGEALDALRVGPRAWPRDAAGPRPPVRGRAPCPFVLVLDNLEAVDTPAVGPALRALVDDLPDGSALALASRRELSARTGFARLELAGRLVRLGAPELAFGSSDVTSVLTATGARAPTSRVRRLVEYTGGWPAAVSVAARHLADTVQRDDEDFFRDETHVVRQYVRDELLAPLTEELRDFLRACAILDGLSGPLCDAVTGSDHSRRLLDHLVRDGLVLSPIDGAAPDHMLPILRDVLRHDLSLDPAVAARLHARASRWFEADDDLGGAIRHARLARGRARAERLLWQARASLLEPGAGVALRQSLDDIPEREVLQSPALTVLAAWCALLRGDAEACERRTMAAEQLLETDRFPPDPSVHAALMLLRAAQARDVQTMLREASLAYERDPRGRLYGFACLLTGAALRLLDRPEQARARLEEGVRVGLLTAPGVETLCRVQLALMALERDATSDAARHIQFSLHVTEEQQLALQPEQAEVFAVAALIDAQTGATRRAHWEVKWARVLLANLGEVVPWIAIEARVVGAGASVHLGRVGQARELLEEAHALTRVYADFGSLSPRLAAVRRQLRDAEPPLGVVASPLTPAELRVLRHLPTHLTYAEIAEQLFVSRNTVKTQAIAAYRKLGVTSRHEAVECARSIGLLR